MNNKQKEKYIRTLSEINLRDYMNGNKENMIGKMELEWKLAILKIQLTLIKNLKLSYSKFTFNDWSKK